LTLKSESAEGATPENGGNSQVNMKFKTECKAFIALHSVFILLENPAVHARMLQPYKKGVMS